MVIAYFIVKDGLTFSEAYHKVRDKRNQAKPNPAFVNQLKDLA